MRFYIIGFLLIIASGACNNSNAISDVYSDTTSFAKDTAISGGVAHESVCMVNDKFMGEKQIPVTINGKTYFGCCWMCEKKLEYNIELRSAVDPYSKTKVNKATAFIAITGEDGSVSYFENAENHKKFLLSRR